MEDKNLGERKKLHAVPFMEEQKRELKRLIDKDSGDIVDFIKRTRAWRKAPSSNGRVKLRQQLSL